MESGKYSFKLRDGKPKKDQIKFGEYLLKKGKICKDQLEKALKLQTSNFVVLGEEAISANFLNEEQVTAIMDDQRAQGGYFWDIAAKLGYLNKDAAEKVLGMIKRDNFLIGEKLVSYGAISKEDLDDEWKQYKQSFRKSVHHDVWGYYNRYLDRKHA